MCITVYWLHIRCEEVCTCCIYSLCQRCGTSTSCCYFPAEESDGTPRTETWTQPSWGDAAVLGGRSLTPSSDEHAFFLAVSSPPPALPPDTLPTSCHSPWLHTYCSILFYKLGSQDTSVIFVLQIFLILADTNHVPIAT